MGREEDGSTYFLSSWHQQPYFLLLEDNGHGCCDDTVEPKALCPRSECRWESLQLHLGHQTSTKSPVKGGWGQKAQVVFFFLISEQYHSSLSTTMNTRAETMDWPPRVHLFKHLLFVISSIIQTAVMGFWQICFWNGDIVFKITLIGLEVGAPLCLFGTS